MSFVDAASYFEQKWGNCKAAVSEISKNDKGVSLVESDIVMFSFDKICDELFNDAKAKKPKSADALRINGNCIELIEFKGGFKRNITKENYKTDLVRCDQHGNGGGIECPWFRSWYRRNRSLETKELITQIRDKAIESYVTLHKKLLPNISSDVCLKFTAIVDGNGDDRSVAILSKLAKKVDNSNSPRKKVRDSLKGITDIEDFKGKHYYYESYDVEVYFADEFAKQLQEGVCETAISI